MKNAENHQFVGAAFRRLRMGGTGRGNPASTYLFFFLPASRFLLLASRFLLLASSFLLSASPALANNIQVTGGTLTDYDAGNHTYDIQFNLSWDNSWRGAGAPSLTSNWDAAWVFGKFSVYTPGTGTWTDWDHAILSTSGSVMAAGSSTVTFADNAGNGVYYGAFIYRDAANTGSGTNTWNNLQLRWNYGAGGTGGTPVADGAIVKVKLFALEMVYIPTGPFYIGDTDCDNAGNFMLNSGCGAGAVKIGTTITSSLCAVANSYDQNIECAGGDSVGTFCVDGDGGLDLGCNGIENASFPTGYNAFYMMKYEVTQGQYVDFLNTLNGTQQAVRSSATSVRKYLNDDNTTSAPDTRGGMKVRVAPNGATAGLYGCDLNNNGIYNEADDGQWVAANWLSWGDLTAYADWAALRPFTELEFEKACRGGQAAVDDESAWGGSGGDASVEAATTSLNNSGKKNETPDRGNLNYFSSTPDGPYRVGSFADGTSTRAQSGGSYYGVMELSGDLWERTVTLGQSAGRSFTGTNGDGKLVKGIGAAYDGNATNTDWPGIDGTAARGVTGATGSGFRGGSWSDSSSDARVSDRVIAANTGTSRYGYVGGRCSRTSP
jgi:formylglycine-generating enzyme required for sulfatase activity